MKKMKNRIIAFLLASCLFLVQSESLITFAAEEIPTVSGNDIIVDEDTTEDVSEDTDIINDTETVEDENVIDKIDENVIDKECQHDYEYTKIDENMHKKVCSICGVEEDNHVFLYEEIDTVKITTCENCDYEKEETIEVIESDEESELLTNDVPMMFSMAPRSISMFTCSEYGDTEEEIEEAKTMMFEQYGTTLPDLPIETTVYDNSSKIAESADWTAKNRILVLGNNDGSIGNPEFEPEEPVIDENSLWTDPQTNKNYYSEDAVHTIDLSANQDKTVLFYIFHDGTAIFSGTGTMMEISMFTLCDYRTYIKRVHMARNSNITAGNSLDCLFYNCINLTEVSLPNLDTSNTTNMESIFSNCSSLKKLDISNLDFSNATTPYGFISGCYFEELIAPKNVTKKIMGESSQLTRLCIFIQGPPNTGKTYAAEQALRN